MLVQHHATIHANCPIEERVDYYDVLVECDGMVKVEHLEAAMKRHRGTRQTQESLCQALYGDISYVRWTLIGRHGQQTDTTVTCPSP